jgi:predicted RecB family nuclease
MASKKIIKTCPNGHKYTKSSDCPTCPVCEKKNAPIDGFLALLAAPARRALQNAGITTLKKLSSFNQNEILKLHGMGPASLPTLKAALQKDGLNFKL